MESLKKLAGEKACEYVKDGMVVGLGTGSTVKYTILKLGKMVAGGLDIKGIPTSIQSERLAREAGIPLTTFDDEAVIDVTIDGADEVDPNLNLIKGGGGALTREKIVAYNSKKEIIVVDGSKMVDALGAFKLPIEVIPLGCNATRGHIESLGASCSLRHLDGKIFVTDNGNYILDADFGKIGAPMELERELRHIVGIVENGLFVNLTDVVIAGRENGIEVLRL